MTASQIEAPDDLDPGSDAAEQSETRMRQALDRLSGDRFPGNFTGSRPSGDRPQNDRSASDRVSSDRPVNDRPGGGLRAQGPSQGSFSSAGPRRHRYVQDGEVPVVQVSTLRDRRPAPPGVAAPEPQAEQIRALLAQERAGRQRAEQLLERAQATLHGLETRLGHAEITQREAVAQSRAHEAELTRLQAENADLALRLQDALAKAAFAEQRQQELLEKQRDLQLKPQAPRFSAEPDPVFIGARFAASADFEPEGFAPDRFTPDHFADELAPEPPPLVARNARPIGRRGRPAKPAVMDIAPPPPPEPEEPEPVKWWLIPSSTTKRKTRKTV